MQVIKGATLEDSQTKDQITISSVEKGYEKIEGTQKRYFLPVTLEDGTNTELPFNYTCFGDDHWTNDEYSIV